MSEQEKKNEKTQNATYIEDNASHEPADGKTLAHAAKGKDGVENVKRKTGGMLSQFPNKKIKKMHILIGVLQILMIAALITVSVFLGITVNKNKSNTQSLENSYQYEYYGFLENLMTIEGELSKIPVCKSDVLREEFLYNMSQAAEKAGNSIGKMVYKASRVSSISRVFNEMSEYGRLMLKQLEGGEALSVSQLDDLVKMRNFTANLSVRFSDFAGEMTQKGYSLKRGGDKRRGSFVAMIDDLEQEISLFESFNYEGNNESVTAKGLEGRAEISEAEAAGKLKEYFSAASSVRFLSESSGIIPAYNYSVVISGGEGIAKISKKGGLLVDLFLTENSNEPKYGVDEITAEAEKFATKLGVGGLVVNSKSLSGSYLLVEFAPKQGDVVLATDTVRLKLSLQSGVVVGVSATGFILNHTEREIKNPAISLEIARGVLGECEADGGSLQLIKIAKKEKLCYVFRVSFAGEKYYVGIDALTAEEVVVKRIVEGAGGEGSI